MDISTLAVVETAKHHVRSPEEVPLYDANKQPVTITLYGPGSTAYKRAQAKIANRIGEKFQRKGKFSLTADERESDQIELLVACTVSFDNFSYPAATGATGAELFRAVYSDPALGFLREQVQQFVNDWSSFTSSSEKS